MNSRSRSTTVGCSGCVVTLALGIGALAVAAWAIATAVRIGLGG